MCTAQEEATFLIFVGSVSSRIFSIFLATELPWAVCPTDCKKVGMFGPVTYRTGPGHDIAGILQVFYVRQEDGKGVNRGS